MRCDGKSVRLGMRTTRRMSRASQPDKQNGTLSAHTIKASGHVHRTNRPNTRLHPTTTPNHQISPCNAGAIHTGHSGYAGRTIDFPTGKIKRKARIAPGLFIWVVEALKPRRLLLRLRPWGRRLLRTVPRPRPWLP